MKKVFALLAVCAVLGAALVGCGSAGTTSETKPDVSSQSSTVVSQSTAPSAVENDRTFSGEAKEYKDWEINVGKVTFGSALKGEHTDLKAKDGSKYVTVDIQVKNLGTESSLFLPDIPLMDYIGAELVYDGKYQYPDTSTSPNFPENLSGGVVKPLETKTGYLAFEVPNEVADNEKQLVLKIFHKTDMDIESTIEFNLR